MKNGKKLIKNRCEIAGCNITDPSLLELHHIVERTELNTTNHTQNLAVLCCTHHKMCDFPEKLKIIGIFPSTKLPNHRTLVYELNGVKNIDIDSSYVEFTPKTFKI